MQLACLEPVAKGLHITHWSSEDLARQAMADAIAPRLSARTVHRILHDADLQPHRTRYGRRRIWMHVSNNVPSRFCGAMRMPIA